MAGRRRHGVVRRTGVPALEARRNGALGDNDAAGKMRWIRRPERSELTRERPVAVAEQADGRAAGRDEGSGVGGDRRGRGCDGRRGCWRSSGGGARLRDRYVGDAGQNERAAGVAARPVWALLVGIRSDHEDAADRRVVVEVVDDAYSAGLDKPGPGGRGPFGESDCVALGSSVIQLDWQRSAPSGLSGSPPVGASAVASLPAPVGYGVRTGNRPAPKPAFDEDDLAGLRPVVGDPIGEPRRRGRRGSAPANPRCPGRGSGRRRHSGRWRRSRCRRSVR